MHMDTGGISGFIRLLRFDLGFQWELTFIDLKQKI